MRYLPFVLLLFAASGCGDADESKTGETAASTEATAAAVVEPEIVATQQTAADRVAFVGRWREIDGKERVELFEDGRVTVAGGEMGFRGKYTVAESITIPRSEFCIRPAIRQSRRPGSADLAPRLFSDRGLN